MEIGSKLQNKDGSENINPLICFTPASILLNL